MLEKVAKGCDTCTSSLAYCESTLNEVQDQLNSLSSFSTNVSSLSNNASRLIRFCNNFWRALDNLSKIAVGPLAVVKTIVTALRGPMAILLRALKTGGDKISSLTKTVNSKLEKLVKPSNIKKIDEKIDDLTVAMSKPTNAIEKFAGIIDMITSVASLGVLPTHLISKFAESESLEKFFKTLDENIDGIKTFVKRFVDGTITLGKPIQDAKDFCTTVASKFDFIRPVDKVLKKLQPYVGSIAWVFEKFSPWWLRAGLNAAMWPINKAIDVIVSPFRRQMNALIEKLNPFGMVDKMIRPFTAPLQQFYDFSLHLETKLNDLTGKLLDFKKVPGYGPMKDSLTQGAAIIQSGIYGIVGGLLLQGSNSIEVLEQMIEKPTMEGFLKEMRERYPGITTRDAILKMKRNSIDGRRAKCDSYLRTNASKDSFYIDGSIDDKLKEYIDNSSYNLDFCEINPSHDKQSALFKYGTANNSWIMASMAALLQYGNLTEQAAKIGAFSSDKVVSLPFVPVLVTDGSVKGKYRVSLHLKKDFEKAFDVDTRFPIKRPNERVPTDVEEIPTVILEYVNDRIDAPVDPVFSETYSWALVQKVVACKLNVTTSTTETVGTGMHLLSGMCSGLCHRRHGNQWKKYLVANELQSDGDKEYDTVKLEPTEETNTGKNLLDLMKRRTLSMKQVKLLDSLHRIGRDNVNSFDRSTVEEAMADLSMFVLVMENGNARAVLYTDDTQDSNIVYADGERIQPLMNTDSLSNYEEVWEYCISTTSNSPEINIASTPITEQRSPASQTSRDLSIMAPSSLPVAATVATTRNPDVPAPPITPDVLFMESLIETVEKQIKVIGSGGSRRTITIEDYVVKKTDRGNTTICVVIRRNQKEIRIKNKPPKKGPTESYNVIKLGDPPSRQLTWKREETRKLMDSELQDPAILRHEKSFHNDSTPNSLKLRIDLQKDPMSVGKWGIVSLLSGKTSLN